MITLKKVRILAPIIVVAGLLGACGSEKDVTSSNIKGKYEITVGLSQSGRIF